MSGGLAPSKSTVYVSNLPFSLTNNDLHKIFEKYGKVVKVTVLKDKDSRQSKGVAFVLFLERESAHKCIQALNQNQMFGRTIRCNIAKDNGRAADFIRRKVYKDKSRCYECGDEGHLSYACPSNLFGERKPPEKKKRKKDGDGESEDEEDVDKKARLEYGAGEDSDEEQEGEDLTQDSLAAAIQFQQSKVEEDEYRYRVATGDYASASPAVDDSTKKKTFKKDAYFSDEEELDAD